MEILSIFFGVITISSFVFALYQRYELKKRAVIENSKVVLQSEKMRDIYGGLRSLGSNIDMIVQTPKHQEVTIQELQNIARGARTQVFALMKVIKGEKKRLDEWRYGKMIASGSLEEDEAKEE